MLRECIKACTPTKQSSAWHCTPSAAWTYVTAWPPEPGAQCRHEHADLTGRHTECGAAGRVMPSAPTGAGAGARLQHDAEHHRGGGVDDGHAAVEHAQAEALGVGRQHERHHGEHRPGRAHRQQRAQRHHRQHECVPAPAAAPLRDHTIPYPALTLCGLPTRAGSTAARCRSTNTLLLAPHRGQREAAMRASAQARRADSSTRASPAWPACVGSLGRRARAHPAVPAPSSLGAQSTSMKHAPPSRPPTTAVYRLMAGVLRKRFCARGGTGRASAPARALRNARAPSATLAGATRQPAFHVSAASGARLGRRFEAKRMHI